MKRPLLITLFLFTSYCIHAQGWGQTQKITPDDRFIGQQFGADVAIDGNYAVVGILVSNSAKDAYVYENDGAGNWVQIQKLQSPNFNQFDHFGTAVAISGDYIFVGAWGEDYDELESNYLDSAGAAYIFKKQGSGLFAFEQKIVASDREALNAFGYGIAVDGDYAILSPVRHDYDASGANFLDDAGAAYIFEKDGNGIWNEVQKIVASDRAVQDFFGQAALAVNGNYIAVGSFADDEDENGNNPSSATGSAYIFERDTNGTWNEIQKVVAKDRTVGDFFGWSIDLDGNNLVVGANQDDNFTGATYIFEKDANDVWNEAQKIMASDASTGDRFGQSVSIDGNHIVVGAYLKSYTAGGTTFPGVGRTYIYEQDGTGTWNQIQNIYALDKAQSDSFGFSVAVSGDNAIVGAYLEDEDESGLNTLQSAGSVYMFNANEASTLSVFESDFNSNFKMFPNPTKGKLTIDLGKLHSNVNIIIHNTLGQEVFSQKEQAISKVTLDLNVDNGVYFISISTKQGQVATFKIIKQL